MKIGDYYQGGFVFYVWSGGTHGYICPPGSEFVYPNNQLCYDIGGGLRLYQNNKISLTQCKFPAYSIASKRWGVSGTYLGTGLSIGSGRNNTRLICAQGWTNTAALYCSGLTLNGYSDWFLPSNDEITEIWRQRSWLKYGSGFETNFMTSSESTTVGSSSYYYIFMNQSPLKFGVTLKANAFFIIPIREF